MADFPRGGYIPLNYHQVMLKDKDRTGAFEKAIEYQVKPGDVVLEVGGGTGVLSFLAAKKARKVYTVEYSPENAEACRRFAALNGLSDKVEVICADAREYAPPEPVDVVLCEMMHVGLVNEQQVPVMNAVLRKLKASQRRMPRVVPFAAINAAQLVHYDFTNWGFQFPFPRFIHAYGPGDEALVQLSEPAIYWKLDFHQENAEEIDAQVNVVATATGEANAIRVVTRTLVDDRLAATPNDWYLYHMVLPLAEPIQVKTGDRVDLCLAYRAGCELDAIQVAARQVAVV